MYKSTRHFSVLVGVFAILALALSAAIPAWAQTGTSNQTGNTVVLQPSDTLGSLVSQYNLSGNDLQQFFDENFGLNVSPGQTVNYPSGVTLNIPGSQNNSGNQGQGTTTETPTAAGGALSTTGTPSAAAGTTTGTPTAAGSGTLTATGTPVAATGAAGNNTYVTQQGDTLGKLLGFMGFTVIGQGTSAGGALATGTPAAGGALATGTPAASGALATGTPAAGGAVMATGTATAAAGTVGGAVTATGTPAAGGLTATGTPASAAGSAVNTGNAVTDQQLQEFVALNNGLSFVAGQTATLPAGIVPATGANQAGQATNTPGALIATGTPAAPLATNTPMAGNATATTVPGGATATAAPGTSQGNATTYTVQSGDTLQSIANQYGITLAQLLAANPNLLQQGETINIPSGTTSIPQTGANQTQRSFTIQNNETLGALVGRYNLGRNDLGQFFAANCDVNVVAGQTVQWPAGANVNTGINGNGGNSASSSNAAPTATPAAGATAATATPMAGTTAATATPMAGTTNSSANNQNGTYTTQQGDTLCSLAQMMGVNMTTLSNSNNASGNSASATATPAAGTSSNANGSSQANNAQSDNQLLWQFYTLNSGLKLENGQTVVVPAGIPQTGGNNQTSGTSGTSTTSSNYVAPVQSKSGSCPQVPAGYGLYKVRPGDSLQSIANKFGITIQQILNLNAPGTIYPGNGILLPGVEAPGEWNMSAFGCNPNP